MRVSMDLFNRVFHNFCVELFLRVMGTDLIQSTFIEETSDES